jgi:hypothetical protein
LRALGWGFPTTGCDAAIVVAIRQFSHGPRILTS